MSLALQVELALILLIDWCLDMAQKTQVEGKSSLHIHAFYSGGALRDCGWYPVVCSMAFLTFICIFPTHSRG